jgi:hypothetical protein
MKWLSAEWALLEDFGVKKDLTEWLEMECLVWLKWEKVALGVSK